MSAKRILEKYTAQRSDLPVAIDTVLKNVSKQTETLEKVTVWQNEKFPSMMIRIEVE